MFTIKISAVNESDSKTYLSELTVSELVEKLKETDLWRFMDDAESNNSKLVRNQEKIDLEQVMAIYPGLSYEQAVNPWIGFGI
jgi:hypothetical protein